LRQNRRNKQKKKKKKKNNNNNNRPLSPKRTRTISKRSQNRQERGLSIEKRKKEMHTESRGRETQGAWSGVEKQTEEEEEEEQQQQQQPPLITKTNQNYLKT